MPTHDEAPRFWRDWATLSEHERRVFKRAMHEMVDDLKAGRGFRPGLRVKGLRRQRGVFEMTWAPDGRALFTYGVSPHEGDVHVTWLRIGTHAILDEK